MILADENIPPFIISSLRANGFDVLSVRENHSGISDEEVIMLARKTSRIIITEDKDFGEWVFSYNINDISVILLRYPIKKLEIITQILVAFLIQKEGYFNRKFITITTEKIRTREI